MCDIRAGLVRGGTDVDTLRSFRRCGTDNIGVVGVWGVGNFKDKGTILADCAGRGMADGRSVSAAGCSVVVEVSRSLERLICFDNCVGRVGTTPLSTPSQPSFADDIPFTSATP